nr:hypothetical protein [uncultured Halomonas sp.]
MQINLNDAKQQLDQLIRLAEEGEQVVIIGTTGKAVLVEATSSDAQGKLPPSSVYGAMKDEITYEEGWDAAMTEEEFCRQ